MTVTFLGGAGTVTGSKFLLESDGARVLVDCGMFQGIRDLRRRNWERLAVDPASIDAVVLTHAHLDHCGYLPTLVRDGFHGPIHATASSVELAAIVLRDAARLQEEEAAYANRKGFSKHRPALPLYTSDDAEAAIRAFREVELEAEVAIAPGVCVRLQRAGHILGSASVLVVVEGGPRVFVSGDVGRSIHPLLRPPAPVPAADVVLVESTYGDRLHEPQESVADRLAATIRRTAARGGTVVIPAFAVDRTEVVLHALQGLRRERRIPDIPVFVDSPMALAVLDVYRDAIARRDGDLRPEIAGGDLFDLAELRAVPTPAESIALNDLRYPAVIISSSGMATGGRVLHHLARCLPDPRNAVALVGYQAVGTRGRDLAEHAPVIKLLGRYVPVRAEVLVADAFSVHADAVELLDWLRPAPPPGTAFAVHGEPDASVTFRNRVDHELGWMAVVPRDGERVLVG